MTARFAIPLVLVAALGCAEMDSLPGSPRYGDMSGTAGSHAERTGRITAIETIQVEDNYRFGVGTAAGAVVGGLIGHHLGDGSAIGTAAGAAAGAAIGTYAESRRAKQDAQRVTVVMATGDQVTIVQPADTRLSNGMDVRVEGSGETARVVPH